MEAKTSFISGRKDRLEMEMDPSMLTMFLETCMKLLCDKKLIRGLQELITRCIGTTPGKPHAVRKLKNHMTQTGREMRLTAQIREYELDQVILDLGSDTSVLPK